MRVFNQEINEIKDADGTPQHWKLYSLPDLLFFQEGPGVRNWQFKDKGVKLLNVGNINNNKINLDATSIYISEEEAFGKYSHFLVDAGDLVIASSGIVVDNFHNKIAFISKEHLPLCMNTSTIRFKVIKKDKICIDYFRIFLRTNFFKSQLKKLITGSAQLNFGPSHLKKIKIPLPPLDYQIRIAHLLGKVEGLISQRKENLQQLDELLKSVFLEMFGDPVRNEKGWNTLSFPEIGKFISGATPSKSRPDYWNGHFPWVSPKDMKVSIIRDSEDHISESAFTESTLKKISPNHLLIVVRGMILAHSFPVAINVVDISINQDMKAIKPIKDVNVVYLQNCLNALKRQILELISSAAHGTKKFDSIAMQKLFIPVPPATLQNQFTVIVEKIESIKSKYQLSLTGLENLYGALSQQAFKGELDLSRVPLVPIDNYENPVVDDKLLFEEKSAKELEMLASLDKPAMGTPEGRVRLLHQWFKDWLHNASPTATLSVPQFWQEAQLRALDYVGEDDENTDFTIAEYDQFKQWLFDAIEQGQILQTQNIVSEPGEELQFGNRVVLKKAP